VTPYCRVAGAIRDRLPLVLTLPTEPAEKADELAAAGYAITLFGRPPSPAER
jgi:hypothetical protein